MYKIISFAALTTLLLACNNHSKSDHLSENADHSTHHTSGNKDTSHVSEIHATMNTMMQKMHAAKPTGNNDIDFATMMIEHHKGAVEMSKVQTDMGGNTDLKTFAQKVIDDQNKEVTLMEDFITKAPKNASANTTSFQEAMTQSMMAMMNDSTKNYNDIDKDYAAQMIPHHQSAVDMAEAYLQFGTDPGLRTLSQDIINSQSKEITWLKEWLAKNGK